MRSVGFGDDLDRHSDQGRRSARSRSLTASSQPAPLANRRRAPSLIRETMKMTKTPVRAAATGLPNSRRAKAQSRKMTNVIDREEVKPADTAASISSGYTANGCKPARCISNRAKTTTRSAREVTPVMKPAGSCLSRRLPPRRCCGGNGKSWNSMLARMRSTGRPQTIAPLWLSAASRLT